MRVFIGIFLAVALHAGLILFGGLLFTSLQKEQPKKPMLVDLFTPEVPQKKEEAKPKEETQAKPQEIETNKPPDATKEAAKLDEAMHKELMAAEPAGLEPMSLEAMSDALNGQIGSGGFGDAVSFVPGGVFGGRGKRGAAADEEEKEAFNIADVEQKPRAIFQAVPLYPAAMRGKKVEGVVSVIFVVDPTGRVMNQRVEKSNNLAFDKPALDAVRQWKFEPGVKGGQHVACKMRVAVRFEPS